MPPPDTTHAESPAVPRPGQFTAMISSTALDLPRHREMARQACLDAGVFPVGIEQLPARDATGIVASLGMVDQADIYIGVYALGIARDDCWRGAEDLAREALRLAEEVGRKEVIAANCLHLAKALARQGRKPDALPHARRAVEIYTALRSPDLEAARQTLAECESRSRRRERLGTEINRTSPCALSPPT